MTGVAGQVMRGPLDGAWPELVEYWFFRRVVLHRVPPRYLRRLRYGRITVSVSHCGKLCGPPFPTGERTVTWCGVCYPPSSQP
ncbi:hypothetical protein [Amycolatopsis sp. CB00013]|uniref:hypothetical protein n=1 Tax=Amycolatopsis sp. CB00013 TaxID=1703945 RepID=UPI0011613FEF|nr:hypothetical protein [Amycolatopsis sp. CB00013]